MATYDGKVAHVGFWRRTLSGAERTSLWNSGTGLAHPFGEGGVSGSGSLTQIDIVPAVAFVTADAEASGALPVVTLSSIVATGAGDGEATGDVLDLSLVSIDGSAFGSSPAAGSLPTLFIGIPFDGSGEGDSSCTGELPVLSITTTLTGSAVSANEASGFLPVLNLTASNASAIGHANVSGTPDSLVFSSMIGVAFLEEYFTIDLVITVMRSPVTTTISN